MSCCTPAIGETSKVKLFKDYKTIQAGLDQGYLRGCLPASFAENALVLVKLLKPYYGLFWTYFCQNTAPGFQTGTFEPLTSAQDFEGAVLFQ